ncbi:MAG: type II toxin-antitoxin system VapB family antitoxin [Gemmatimonadetes bacterium]|uniref:Type II toxin-antitoxin system VapB family antitoxin n=1 Tax=Candidatus Kutchimonas denitrificans TaxID=3056748 RepID=A0AAE4Z967_9BACT|nr:type II toxin-antitoxin system VapB family antitoxin [Gemmatimonadota bacterium]NIR74782.1 type II toxin-antitoxin system VapB family antitoxin [Candidatus Kutchimonas denitrificans]NIS01532.1 type II toxin-antitoxin system VapB family antitoxin [Gemmatimonadota bacterium]NIT67273.1 type II toxin-antitoxin system VapB family antitoxin [Gemmatimonadota bacterium]NIU52447.1 type II toxin-antitoxin system VapB family antitoxin [Gemmatimonadota bacterium]
MRTTLNLDDDLMRDAKQHAAMTGRTLTALIETALRELLWREKREERDYRLRWVTVEGGVQSGVDLTDRDALLERMEGEPE